MQTEKGAYAYTPHKTIEELCALAKQRTGKGEDPYFVRQDITNGYSLGFGSRNDWAVQCACEEGHEIAESQRKIRYVAIFEGKMPENFNHGVNWTLWTNCTPELAVMAARKYLRERGVGADETFTLFVCVRRTPTDTVMHSTEMKVGPA